MRQDATICGIGDLLVLSPLDGDCLMLRIAYRASRSNRVCLDMDLCGRI